MTASIETRGLLHEFPATTRDGLPVAVLEVGDLTIDDGQFVAIVGPSGCGKSTLLRILAGLQVPSAGTTTVGGANVVGRPGHAGFMGQKDMLLPWRRAIDNAVLGADIDHRDSGEARDEARALFDRFGLGGFERAWPAQLSGGMRQRVALLRTVLLHRTLMLLDEPFGALDVITRREMVIWLQEVLAVDSQTVVFVTHDVEEGLLLADRLLVMSPRPGRVIADLPVSFSRPRSPDLVVDPSFVALRGEVLKALARR